MNAGYGMRTITMYHRPTSLGEALDLMAREGVSSVVVAGGTVVNSSPHPPDTEVIDLQAICGNTIESENGRLVIGAMTRLQTLVENPAVPSLLRELTYREGPNTLRNAATIGGTVAAGDPDSELLAGLLVYEATVRVEHQGRTSTLPVADLLADRRLIEGGIISSISIATGGTTASARTGRTPADVSIVAAIGRSAGDGVLLALTGVAATPILATRETIAHLDPSGDFRGSADYRIDLAGTLAGRVFDQLGGVA